MILFVLNVTFESSGSCETWQACPCTEFDIFLCLSSSLLLFVVLVLFPSDCNRLWVRVYPLCSCLPPVLTWQRSPLEPSCRCLLSLQPGGGAMCRGGAYLHRGKYLPHGPVCLLETGGHTSARAHHSKVIPVFTMYLCLLNYLRFCKSFGVFCVMTLL